MSIPPYCGPISIHALREEGDDPGYHGPDIFKPFLSTPSARRATSGPTGQTAAAYAISIHALREEGDRAELYPRFARYISIHALREEGDFALSVRCFQPSDFYPRPPRGGRPSPPASVYSPSANFYPRPPRGGRQVDRSGRVVTRVFLSTPSARRATLQCLVTWSSHRYFYPRPPRGGRLVLVWSRNSSEGFLSTPSARRATPAVAIQFSKFMPFLSTPSARRATFRPARP